MFPGHITLRRSKIHPVSHKPIQEFPVYYKESTTILSLPSHPGVLLSHPPQSPSLVAKSLFPRLVSHLEDPGLLYGFNTHPWSGFSQSYYLSKHSSVMILAPPSQTFHETEGEKCALVSTSGQDSTTTFSIKMLCKFLFSDKSKPYHPGPFMIYLHLPQRNLLLSDPPAAPSPPSFSQFPLPRSSCHLN